MTRENFKGKLTATRNLRRARFNFRLFFIMTSLLIIAVWMDYWIRGELGAAKKYVEIARGKWEMAVLIAGGMIYILLLSLPFVSGAHWFSLNIMSVNWSQSISQGGKKMDIFEKIADTVIDGDKDKKIVELIEEALAQNLDPIDILENGLRKGIDVVGMKFEQMEIFLPEMVRSADAMMSAIDVLRPSFKAMKDESSLKKEGTVVIGTIHHDLHDIGKNIVSTFLEISGFEVYDLGIDVPADEFVDKAEEKEANIIALSALLSTTAPYMKDVIAELNRRGLRSKYTVMVGGGIITQEFADEIGADGYGKDFTAAVQVAKELVELRR
jgi:corrinoid protein of di/trimethylamine methyltransferase